MATGIRKVNFGTADVLVDPRPDGTKIIRVGMELGSYPDKMTQRLEQWARSAPDRVFLAARDQDGDWRTLTYAAALNRVRQLGQSLLARGLNGETTIAILSGNGLEHALLGLAAQYVGVPYAPISPAYSLVSSDFGKLRQILGELQPRIVFAENGLRFQEALRATVPEHAEIVVAKDPPGSLRCTLFEDIVATPTSALDAARRAVRAETIAKILYTSGSTGAPKGVINTQRMLCSNQQMLAQVFPFLTEEPPVFLDWLPWHHTFGGNHNFNMALFNGGSYYIDDGRPVGADVSRTVRNLREISPTIYFNVPKGYESLLPFLNSEFEFRRRFFAGLKVLFYAGAGLSAPIWNRLQEIAVETRGYQIPFVSSLGATETAPASLICNRASEQAGLVGVPAPGVDVKLVPSGDKTELRVRGPNVTPGYWRRDDLTEKAFDDEGFYFMGDAVRFADIANPALGFVFDGRITEDFKLNTGTWVNVAALRLAILARFSPLISDIIITGHDRAFVGMLMVPNLPGCRELLSDVERGKTVQSMLDHPSIRSWVQEALDEFVTVGTGSSNRVVRAAMLDEPPSFDAGEITDKGSINQRAVLTRRSAIVERLYASEPDGHILVAGI